MSRHPGGGLFGMGPVEPDETATLPALYGTERQIAWAEQIRKSKLAGCRKLVKDWLAYAKSLEWTNPERAAEERRKAFAAGEGLERAESQASASFWINHRENTPLELVNGSDARPGDGYGDGRR